MADSIHALAIAIANHDAFTLPEGCPTLEAHPTVPDWEDPAAQGWLISIIEDTCDERDDTAEIIITYDDDAVSIRIVDDDGDKEDFSGSNVGEAALYCIADMLEIG
jgi:hypothetical protein